MLPSVSSAVWTAAYVGEDVPPESTFASAPPQTTTVLSARNAAKVPEVPAICTTAVPPFSCADTRDESPPCSGEPHVTTAPPPFNAANALSVEKMLATSFSSTPTRDESPPKVGEPHVTTVLSAFSAANAYRLENTLWGGEEREGGSWGMISFSVS